MLATATPDDGDIEILRRALDVTRFQRVSVSRASVVTARLNKQAVQAVSFSADGVGATLVDMNEVALRAAVTKHRELGRALNQRGVKIAPLLLVQAGSEGWTPNRIKELLTKKLDFSADAVAVHTADEPDPDVHALARDPAVEVLIFKMAVALGFDAPRAFTLVSMRAAKDEDFGVQLLGRILRVHRRLQSKTVPEALNYGYVLLANPDGQSGLQAAGVRMNAMKTEMDKTSPTVAVMCVGGVNGLQLLGKGGETQLFPITSWGPTGGGPPTGKESARNPPSVNGTGGPDRWEPGELNLDGGTLPPEPVPPENPGPPPGLIEAITGVGKEGIFKPDNKHRYALKPGVPRRFLMMTIPEEVETLDEDCAKHFFVESDTLISGMVSSVQVTQRTLEVFTGQLMLEFAKADLSVAEVARRAFDVLCANTLFHPKDLRALLLARLKQILEAKGLTHLTAPAQVSQLLNSMLVARPGLLKEAQKKAIGQHATVAPAADLPEALEFESTVTQSPRNIYGIYPPGMNLWEKAFAEDLDKAPETVIDWWHRNERMKPYSVNLILPTGARFYPDFVIKVHGRSKENGILLADPKDRWEQEKQHDKVLAEHPQYGRALIVTKTGQFGWHTIVWDHKTQKPALGSVWSWENAAGF
jgi:hypothetical protein